MATSAVQVLLTYELLEPILFGLSTKDLLFSQRVCKKWQAVIDNSTKLQQALFFKSIASTTPFIMPYWPAKLDFKFVVNPLLRALHINWGKQKIYPGETLLGSTRGPAILPPSMLAENASWRKMLPTQPASVPKNFKIFLWTLNWEVEKVLQHEDASDLVKAYAARFGNSEDWKWWDDVNEPVEQCYLGEIFERLDEKLKTVPDEFKDILVERTSVCGTAECECFVAGWPAERLRELRCADHPSHNLLYCRLADKDDYPALESNDELTEMIELAQQRRKAGRDTDSFLDQYTKHPPKWQAAGDRDSQSSCDDAEDFGGCMCGLGPDTAESGMISGKART
ncbi:hypothetical protein LTR09_011121 [Extremus antarcticus]|uniref:F-box domain-containing protein n=1 Tax=Extremus antarcticus TaxID=702011 RepID=A0AAJ0DCJ9_9PEZI|nr:hypothetical protein LTR09_011121 [Extremus antarcticus]